MQQYSLEPLNTLKCVRLVAFPFNLVSPIDIHDLFFNGDVAKMATNERK